MNINTFLLAFFCGCILLFTSCQEAAVGEGTSKVFTMNGEVIDDDSNLPVEGALVTLNPSLSSTLTDSAGQFSFAEVSFGVESYTLNIEADNYRRYIQAISTESLPEVVSLIVAMTPIISDLTAPTVPSSPSPFNGEAGVSTEVRLSWEAEDDSPDELRFDVFLFDMSGDVTVARGLDSAQYEIEGLNFGESFTWQVAAYDGVQDTVYSPVWQFTTDAVPGFTLAFDRTESNSLQIYTGDIGVAEEDLYLVTRSGAQSFKPKFSPDGNNMAYLELSGVDAYLTLANSDGSSATRIFNNPINPIDLNLYDFDWTPTGSSIVFGYLNQLWQVDVGTRRVTRIRTFQGAETVQEVTASPIVGTFAVNLVSNNGLQNTVLSFSTINAIIDTIMADTVGLVSGIEYSPSGNQILMAIDQSGQESQTLRQLDAQLFEFEIATGVRFNVSGGKAAGLNDLSPSYSVDGAFIYFTRGSNRLDREPAIWRVARNATNADLVMDRGRNPTLR
ncbi:MAG: carboxypeptidase regulatory-like domain-containing protein [Saprospiraceae bacterium]